MKVVYVGQEIDLAELVRDIMRPDRLSLYDPWFERYHRWLGEDWKLDNYVRYLQTLFRQAGVSLRGKRVLDAGCGFGLTALFLNLLGAEEVHGLDCHEGMIRTFETYLALLPYPLRTYPRLGDVASMPYEDGSFDIVLSIEAISHYRDVERFFSEAGRVLRVGGSLIIVDGNNMRHKSTVRKTRQIWETFENGPATENIHGHRVEKPFVEVRREMIAGAYPHLSAGELDELSRQTAGLWGEQVLEAARTYVEQGKWPGRRWDGVSCPLDPRHGYYIENLLDPLALAKQLRQYGFRTTVRAYFGGARGGFIQWANDILTRPAFSPWTLRFSSSYRILARKMGSQP